MTDLKNNKSFTNSKNLTDRSLNAWLYLYSKNFEARSTYETWALSAVKKYVKEATIGKCDIDRIYEDLSKVQSNHASNKELEKQEKVAENAYELLPKRSARKHPESKTTPQSLATFVCQIRDVKNSKENFNA